MNARIENRYVQARDAFRDRPFSSAELAGELGCTTRNARLLVAGWERDKVVRRRRKGLDMRELPKSKRWYQFRNWRNGAVVWEGRSRIGDRGRVAVVVTGLVRPSLNAKTSGMLQAWVLPMDHDNLNAAVARGDDTAACGSCPFRPSAGGACYVQISTGPHRVWYTHANDPYPRISIAQYAGRHMRIGAWGDPAAVPSHVWRDMLPHLAGWSGYTHEWRDLDSEEWGFLMASTEDWHSTALAQRLGWRTFRARREADPLLPGERMCPASKEAGEKLDCIRCGQCDGSTRAPGRPSRAIVAHGFRHRRFE